MDLTVDGRREQLARHGCSDCGLYTHNDRTNQLSADVSRKVLAVSMDLADTNSVGVPSKTMRPAPGPGAGGRVDDPAGAGHHRLWCSITITGLPESPAP